jgi:hypothetical protein
MRERDFFDFEDFEDIPFFFPFCFFALDCLLPPIWAGAGAAAAEEAEAADAFAAATLATAAFSAALAAALSAASAAALAALAAVFAAELAALAVILTRGLGVEFTAAAAAGATYVPEVGDATGFDPKAPILLRSRYSIKTPLSGYFFLPRIHG